MKDLMFNRLFNSSLLFYSWSQLKNSDLLYSCLGSVNKFSPFSNSWFKKTAFLIKNGRYVYTRTEKVHFFKYKRKSSLLVILAQAIIELSFVNLISYSNKNKLKFDLTQCVRGFKDNLICFLLTLYFLKYSL